MTNHTTREQETSHNFSVLLTPNRSLSPEGFFVLMGIITIIAFVSGLVFVAVGAWPIFGFLGLDVLLIYWLFKKNYRDGMVYEQVIYSPDEITVEREKFGRQKQVWTFQPTWLRIECEKLELGAGPLLLSSHGNELEIAAFLGAEEKLELAETLQKELGALKSPIYSS